MTPRDLSRTRSDGRTTVLFCLLAALCEGIDLQAAGVAAAGIVAEYHPTDGQLGVFFSASTAGLFFGALWGGRLADRVGRKTVLTTSIAVFGVFSLLTAFMPGIVGLTTARLLTGLGLGGALPNLIALVSESAATNRRNASVALVYGGAPLGGAVASFISLETPASQWRWIFIVGGIIPLLLSPVMLLRLKESASFQREVAGIVQTQRSNLAVIFADGRAVRTGLLWLSFFLALLSLYLILNWLPTLVMSDGFTRTQAAATQIIFNAGGAVAALVTGRLLDSKYKKPALIAIFTLLPLVLSALALSPPILGIVLVAVALLGCAMLASQAFLYAAAPAVYPTRIRALGVGTAVAVGRLGSVVGPFLGGVLKAAGHSSSQLLLDIVPIVILGSLFALSLAAYSAKSSANHESA